MDTPIIKKTSDYTIFNSVKFNRDKNKRHIESLKKMLLKENLLHLHPILVNEKMEVVDGQHRLEAAKDLGLEVFYIQDRISYEHILNSNLFQKKMSLGDVIKFYSLKDELPDYIELHQFLEELDMSPKALMGLFFGTTTASMIEFIKSGKFKMPKDSQSIKDLIKSFSTFIYFAKDKRLTPFSMFYNANFTIAFRNIYNLSGFNEKMFYNKLDMRWFELKPQVSSKEWTKLLISIYNWKNQNPLEENA